ncbi:hypothetical protein [Desulfobacula sp.]|uniref:hypothetical protein n=1 Tax=Desulfobacula sp. TaxID=2593537 RepID=UPI001ED3EDA8|nr:hypothetical protein [Desulfobacula sp.]
MVDSEISTEMKHRIYSALETTWQCLAHDWLALFENGECSDTDVYEGIVDADLLLVLGEDVEAARAFYALDRETRWKVFKEHFKYERYRY